MRKKLRSILALVLVAATLSSFALADSASDYEIDSRGAITDYNGDFGDLVLPDGAKLIAEPSPFAGEDAVTSVTASDTMDVIGIGAFENCRNLKTVTLGVNIQGVGVDTFKGCSSLESLYITGTKISGIRRDAFLGCNSLTDVYFAGTEEQWNELEIQDGNDAVLEAEIHFNYRYIEIPTVSTAQEAADFLYELGLFQGTAENADGTPVFELERTPTRFEAITMLVRLLGAEDEALSGSWSTPFTDLAEWAAPYVGYAYAKGLTDGTSETTYGGGDSVNATQFLTFVLRALGYESGEDFQWDAAWQLTDALEITDGQFGAGSGFTRGDVAFTSVRALDTELKAGGETLLESISGKLTLPERPAEEPETPEEPEEETPSETETPSEPDYASYARRTFARVKARYYNATPNFARYQAYTNADGDRCVLVVVSYTIISNYTQTDLYNLDTGAVITNPTSYYQQLANRSYGANKIYYMDLYGEVLQQYMAALRSGVQVGPELLVA